MSHPIATRLTELRRDLGRHFMEREDVIEALMLAVLAGEHIFQIGPPGAAKTNINEALISAFTGSRLFECQFNRHTTPEQVFGPVDIKRFREQSDYVLKRDGFASTVEFAHFDELGKANSSVLNTMLALLNERRFYEGGVKHDAPLSTAFVGANELPTTEEDGLGALWDRLLVRVPVEYLENDDNFVRLFTLGEFSTSVEIPWEELAQVIKHDVPAIEIPESVLRTLAGLRGEFRRHHLQPSDRRWRQSRKILQASAFLDGRTEVSTDDIAALRFVLWDTLEQIDLVQRLCAGAANPFVEPLMKISDAVKEIDNGITERENSQEQSVVIATYGKEAVKKLGTARDQLDSLLMEAAGRRIPGFKKVSDEHLRIAKRAFTVCLEMTNEQVEEFPPYVKLKGSGDGEA